MGEHPPMTDNAIVVERATAFIKRNIVPANFNRFACGDGRYPHTESEGGLRIFGEDMGTLAAYWQAGKDAGHFTSIKDVGKCVREYQRAKVIALGTLKVTGPEAGRLYLHTDDHAEGKGYGCGHMKNLASGEHAATYGAQGKELDAIFQYILDPANNIDHKVTKLHGHHSEGAVILVEGSEDFSIRSSDDTGEMHFVVDLARVRTYFNRLSTALHVGGVSEEALMDAYTRHQNVTASILAPGKPMLRARILDKGTVEISRIQDVPHLAA